MRADERRTIRAVILALDGIAGAVDRDAIDAYRGIQDTLISLLPADPRSIKAEAAPTAGETGGGR